MIIGSVNAEGEAVTSIRLRGPQAAILEIQAVIDTGFNGWLTLSREQIAALELTFREEGRYVLADGSVTVSRHFTAEMEWLGSWRRVLVVEMDGGPLLGMAVLRGSFLGIEVVTQGRVEVRPISGQ